MRFVATALLVIGIGIASTGCCCPLGTLLSLCIPNTGAQALAGDADRAKLDEVPATVPVVATQRF